MIGEGQNGVLQSLGLGSVLPEGWEAPDVGGWLDEHPHMSALGEKVAGGLAVVAIGALLKRYLARRARLAQMAKAAEAERAAMALAHTESPLAAPHEPTLERESLASLLPQAFQNRNRHQIDRMQDVLFNDNYHDEVPKFYYGR